MKNQQFVIIRITDKNGTMCLPKVCFDTIDARETRVENLIEMANHFELSTQQTINLIGGHPILLK